MKLELVLSYWDDRIFVSRDMISADNIDMIKEQFNIVIDKLLRRVDEDNKKKYTIIDDDDITF